MRTAGVLIAIAVITGVSLLLVATYGGVSEDIAARIDYVPGQHEQLLSETEAAHTWKEAYDLELTGTGIQPERVSFDAGRAAVLDVSSQQAMLIDVATKNFQRLPTLPEKTTAILADEGEVFIYARGLYLWDEDKQTWLPQTSDLDLPEEITMLRLFDHNFYAAGSQQIFKLAFKNGKFVEASAWLDEEERLDGLQDFYLDGYLYASTPGKITRYLRGEPTAWSLEATLSGRVLLDGDYNEQIFALLPAQNSLLVADNQGSVTATFSDSLLGQAQFFGFQEGDGSLFTLIGQKIYQYAGSLSPGEDQNGSE